MVEIGDRVRITGLQARGFTGEVVDRADRLGQRRWVVNLDSPSFGHSQIKVSYKELEPEDGISRFTAGQRVTFATLSLRGRVGTLIRPARLLWKKAWLVDVEGLARTRVTERALIPEHPASAETDAPPSG